MKNEPRKIELTEIDNENWRFVLYETRDGEWIGDFVYSPVSFVDLSMLVRLTENEQLQAKNNRDFLIDLADRIRNNHTVYLPRAMKRDDFTFIDKNELIDLFSSSMGNTDDKFVEYAVSRKIDYQNLIAEFKAIQNQVYNYIYQITEPNIQLRANEIEKASYDYCNKNINWINNKGIKAINRWLIWMCWHEGILKKNE